MMKQGGPSAPSESLAAAIQAAAARLAVDPARTRRETEALLKAAPNDPRVLLLLGSAKRRLGDAKGAHAVLAPLAKAYPNAANTAYELGMVLADLGRPAEAVAALRRATALNRDHLDAWRVLGDVLFAQGDVEAADAAFAEHARAAVQDPALKPAASALFEGRLNQAERALVQHLRARPRDAVALALLGQVLLRQARYAEAETVLAQALAVDPEDDATRFSYATALFHQQKAPLALPQVERLVAQDPKSAAYRNLLAACLGLVGEDGRVNALYEGLLAEFGQQPRIWLNYAHALRTVGRRDEAVAAYRRCIALAPATGDAYWGLANLKVASFSPEEAAGMAAQLQRSDLRSEDRLHLHFALGKALEDRGEYAGAFAHYAEGAALRRAETPYDADEITASVRRSEALFTKPFFAARIGGGSASTAPIFILGLPRSGSTLVEQILASHSAVEGTMELPDIGFIATQLGQGPGGYPAGLADLDVAALAALGEGYIESTEVHRKLGRTFFIDKMPNNFHHIGLIQLILPHAKIIDARRHPLGSCFSAFKQHFAQGQGFSYDLTDLGRYYRDYVELMDHFDAVSPGRIHRVIYEDLVEDTEVQVRRLLDHCGLPFEDRCLRFYENERAVRTASSEQVRQPIFRDAVEHWRNYEPWLEPLKAALGPVLQTYPEAPTQAGA